MQSNPSSLLNQARHPRNTFPVPPSRRVAAEAVDVAPLAPLGRDVVVAVGVAVEEEVVGAADAVDADGLPVVHAEPLVDVVAAVVLEADRLRVPLERHLDPDDFQPLDVEPRAADVKGVDPDAGGLDRGEVEDGPLVPIGPVIDPSVRRAALVQEGDVREDPLPPRDLALAHDVRPAADPDRVPRGRRVLRPLHRGERPLDRPGVAVAPGRRHEELRGACGRGGGQQQEHGEFETQGVFHGLCASVIARTRASTGSGSRASADRASVFTTDGPGTASPFPWGK